MPDYKVVRADLTQDRQTIIRLWQQNLSDTRKLQEKYDWHFLQNPYGQARSWILLADGQPIGTTSLGIRPLKINDDFVIAGVGCDLAVNVEHRSLQPALLLQRAMISNAEDVPVIYGLPNPEANAVLKRAGYQAMGQVHRYAKILRISSYLKRRPIVGKVAPLLGGIADLTYRFSQRSSSACRSDLTVLELRHFDERFDNLWQRCRNHHPALIVREARFLRWRYNECPLQTYTTLAVSSSDKLVGYLIYYQSEDVAICADIFCVDEPSIGECLLSAWMERALKAGSSSMSMQCSLDPGLMAVMQNFGFVQRTRATLPPANVRKRQKANPVGRTLLVCGRLSAERGQAFPKDWYFTSGDEPYN